MQEQILPTWQKSIDLKLISCDFLEYAPEKLTEDVKNGILLNAAK